MSRNFYELQELAKSACEDVEGMRIGAAIQRIESAGLRYRVVRRDGHGCMITADCRMDRIGLYVDSDIVVGAEVG